MGSPCARAPLHPPRRKKRRRAMGRRRMRRERRKSIPRKLPKLSPGEDGRPMHPCTRLDDDEEEEGDDLEMSLRFNRMIRMRRKTTRMMGVGGRNG